MHRMFRFIALLALAGILAACGGPGAATTPTSAPVGQAIEDVAEPTEAIEPTDAPAAAVEATAEPTSAVAEATAAEETEAAGGEQTDEEIMAAIQETLDQWGEAMSEGDVEKLREVIDPKNMPFKRVLETRLKLLSESAVAGINTPGGKVIQITPRDLGYVQALVETPNGAQRYFIFKQVDGRWLMSEPRRAELGKRQKIETDKFVFEYYPWDEEIIDEIQAVVEQGHNDMVEKLGRGPDTKVLVDISPTAETNPGGTRGTDLASYRGLIRARNMRQIAINAPGSYGFGTFDPSIGWEKELGLTVAHEYVHLISDCCFTSLARMSQWMIEGVSVYVSEGGHTNGYVPALAEGVRNDVLWPIEDKTAKPGQVPEDLQNLAELPRDVALAYGQAAALVDYIATNFGGLDAFWKLVGEYDKQQRLAPSVEAALGITLEELEKGYLEDLQKRYGS